MVKSLHCLISGKVQGVNFRLWIHDHAKNLGIKGWVRNLHDGRVEVLGQGEDDKLQDFKVLLAQGSTMTRIEHIESETIDYEKEFTDFEMRK